MGLNHRVHREHRGKARLWVHHGDTEATEKEIIGLEH